MSALKKYPDQNTTALVRHKTDKNGNVKVELSVIKTSEHFKPSHYQNKGERVYLTNLEIFDMSKIEYKEPAEPLFDYEAFTSVLKTKEGRDALEELRTTETAQAINEFAQKSIEGCPESSSTGGPNKVVQFIRAVMEAPYEGKSIGLTRKQIWKYFILKGLIKS